MNKNRLETLPDWLRHCESIHPKVVDLGLSRVGSVARKMNLNLGCIVIIVSGTNGKGSTCAMLESILRQAGYRTALYSSPHLVRFEERLRLSGETVNANDLIPSFARVEEARVRNDQETSLTFFEFTTLAFFDVISRSDVDVAILEVGLGGRLDAVNLIDADCAVITSIDIDHVGFLGTTREAIGFEKAGIMRPGRPVVVCDPLPPQSIFDHAAAIGADLWRNGVDFQVTGDKQQWAFSTSLERGSGGRESRYSGLAYPALRGANQLLNAAGVLAALIALRHKLPVTAQAIRNGFALVELPGRFQLVPGQPAVVLDVAHNPHAVAALAANLDAMGYYPTTHAVFGAMADKDILSMIQIMNPLVDHWYFTDLPTDRAESAIKLSGLRESGRVQFRGTLMTYPDPPTAVRAAFSKADPTDRIVVFGSFFTVGAVLEFGISNLQTLPKIASSR
jgi:dihydrofolate synthase / folylpolyglutamate synthase